MIVIASLTLLAWVYLCLFHGRFWHCDQRLNLKPVNQSNIPSVVAVIPARDEVETISTTVRSLLNQDYPGDFSIIVVDDNSTDGTAAVALSTAVSDAERSRIQVVDSKTLKDGWVGKMWAVSQGVEVAGNPDYLLLTDADIEHVPSSLSSLVAKAEAETLGLVSLMVKLRCQSVWEKLLIPAFIYFFQKLYPFPKVNNPDDRIAAAAGGCMLVHNETLVHAGGIEKINDDIIDDCALARIIKPHRPIWLGLSDKTQSLRAYESMNPIWRMVTRTAYVQLNLKLLLLLVTVIGMGVLYLTPPMALVIGFYLENTMLLALGFVAWVIMAWTFLPTLSLYGLNSIWALILPLAGLLYLLMTLDSARVYYAGQGGAWKGRTYGP
jgi:hopene-associated glycosyltransferase HpnB